MVKTAMPDETTEEWMWRIGSKQAMEKRQMERLAQTLNKPKKVWGLRKCVEYLIERGIVEPRAKR